MKELERQEVLNLEQVDKVERMMEMVDKMEKEVEYQKKTNNKIVKENKLLRQEI